MNNPTRTPYNPLDLGSITSGGRQRAIGTFEVVDGTGGTAGNFRVGGIRNTPNSMGYFFFSWGNIAKIQGQAKFQCATLDGVDPIGATTVSANQQLPNCVTTTCGKTLWVGGVSFPTLRDGSYKSWSLYRRRPQRTRLVRAIRTVRLTWRSLLRTWLTLRRPTLSHS